MYEDGIRGCVRMGVGCRGRMSEGVGGEDCGRGCGERGRRERLCVYVLTVLSCRASEGKDKQRREWTER